MEKRNQNNKRIAITGPESTGKTVMSEYLAGHFQGLWVPEYAREYVCQLDRHYLYDDLETIARKQIGQYEAMKASRLVFFDTWLVITKVWFDWAYGKVPAFVEDAILECPIDLYLLLKPDLPWEADPARENGGENRIRLYERYKAELDQYGFQYKEVGGIGEERLTNACREINDFLK